METCPECSFAWDAITTAQITPRVQVAAAAFASVVRTAEDPTVRPATEVWSIVEYGCHVRDVLLNLRDRIMLGAVTDNPTPRSMFVDARVELGLYAHDSAPVLATEIEIGAALFTRTFDALPPGYDQRPIFYPWPVPATRTLRWVAAQALHECEHHLADAQKQTSSPS